MILEPLFLGILQGITEFLPVSSSGHLVLAQSIIPGFEAPGLVFDVILHAGTLFAAVMYYRRDILWLLKGLIPGISKHASADVRSWIMGLILASLPAAIAGIAVGDVLESYFENPFLVSILLCVTGLLLLTGEWLSRKRIDPTGAERQLDLPGALTVGMAQALALLPGISRSGSTISAGLAIGWSRETATRFSFLLMIPAVSGALILKSPEIPELLATGQIGTAALLTGFLSSFVAGYAAIAFMMRMLKKYSFKSYAVYCLLAGFLSVILQSI